MVDDTRQQPGSAGQRHGAYDLWRNVASRSYFGQVISVQMLCSVRRACPGPRQRMPVSHQEALSPQASGRGRGLTAHNLQERLQ
jgi:hypothetical protein